MHRFKLLLVLLALGVAVSGCGDDDSGSASPAAISVVATTTQLGDFARQVGGDRADVRQILTANADPHDYEPRPSDARALEGADVVLRSGGDLDGWLGELIESSGTGADEVELIESVEATEGEHGHEEEHAEEEEHTEEVEHAEEDEHAGEEAQSDPHWWQNPRNAARAVEAIRDALVKADPEGRAAYERNTNAYLAKLRSLDSAVAGCIGKLPRSARKLVTTHDALGYYADRYGLDVIGAVIPSLSSQAQPSSKDVGKLVGQIRRERVRAIFPESSLNSKLERAIARESGARIGGELWADTLGPDGSSGETYIDSVEANTRAIADGLSGGTVRCF